MTRTTMGLDISLTGTGLVVKQGPDLIKQRLITTAPEDGPRHSRITYIACQIAEAVREYEPDLVGIENYAFGKQYGTEPLMELGGVVKHYLFHEETPWSMIPPQSLKARVLGGIPKKPKDVGKERHRKDIKEMMVQVARDMGCNTYDDNVADAYHVATWAQDEFSRVISQALETVG